MPTVARGPRRAGGRLQRARDLQGKSTAKREYMAKRRRRCNRTQPTSPSAPREFGVNIFQAWRQEF